MEKTHWVYEYGVRLPDGTFEFSENQQYPWSKSDAQRKAESWNLTAYRLRLTNYDAKVVRRKVTTTVIVRRNAWEDAR